MEVYANLRSRSVGEIRSILLTCIHVQHICCYCTVVIMQSAFYIVIFLYAGKGLVVMQM